jgi:glutathione synthase/RimK-type ligase-like ATP-grasp enzyme
MILLFGVLADAVTAFVCSRLVSRKLEFLLLDGRHSPQEFGLTWSIEDGAIGGAIHYGARQVALEEVRSVFVRQFGVSDRPGNRDQNGNQGASAQGEVHGSLAAFADTMPVLVVNRPAASSSNRSKPLQQQIIARHGFAVPRTLVTTVPEEARRFYDECRGRVVYKSVSSVRSIVQRLSPDDLERLEQVRWCPTQFQEYIPGIEVRVHVIGRRIFATEIITDAVDYRYAGRDGAAREMRAVELPAEVAERCRRLAEALGLVTAGVDLRRSPAGDYYCWEVNPSPGFTFYQANTGQRIGEALVDLLARGAV